MRNIKNVSLIKTKVIYSKKLIALLTTLTCSIQFSSLHHQTIEFQCSLRHQIKEFQCSLAPLPLLVPLVLTWYHYHSWLAAFLVTRFLYCFRFRWLGLRYFLFIQSWMADVGSKCSSSGPSSLIHSNDSNFFSVVEDLVSVFTFFILENILSSLALVQ